MPCAGSSCADKNVARPEAFELVECRRHPLFRNRIDNLLYGRIQACFRLLRER